MKLVIRWRVKTKCEKCSEIIIESFDTRMKWEKTEYTFPQIELEKREDLGKQVTNEEIECVLFYMIP